jgi:hypothetical protein
LITALFAVVVLIAALVPFLLSKNPSAQPPAEVAEAARQAQSLEAELHALPISSPLLHLPPGETSFTFHDSAPSLSSPAPARQVSREWTVEGLRFDRSLQKWLSAPGGTRRDAVRITIRIRKGNVATGVLSGSDVDQPVLARVVFFRALVEGDR